MLAVIAVGVVLAALERPTVDEIRRPDADGQRDLAHPQRAILLAIAAAGGVLHRPRAVRAPRRRRVPPAWVIVASRTVGVLLIVLPLVLTAPVPTQRPAVPLVVLSPASWRPFGWGVYVVAATTGIAVAAVLSSQFAGIAAIGGFLLFGERLRRLQVAGVVIVADRRHDSGSVSAHRALERVLPGMPRSATVPRCAGPPRSLPPGAGLSGRVDRPVEAPRHRAGEAPGMRVLKPWRLSSDQRCVVCGGAVWVVDITRAAKQKVTCRMEICSECGHVSNPGNVHDYRQYTATNELPLRPRVGTTERKGREFFMAQMAIEILGRDDLDVLVYSAGRSLDNHHIARLPGVRSVAISDVMRLRDDAEFYDSSQPAPRRFSVVIASEVIEHFLNPREDFERLAGFAEPDGLLVCSTNVYDGGELERQPYIFIPGHTSYYSPGSLAVLAAANGLSVDMRVPLVATGYGGPRKRYVLFTASPTVQDAIKAYFRGREYAPSEPPWEDEAAAH